MLIIIWLVLRSCNTYETSTNREYYDTYYYDDYYPSLYYGGYNLYYRRPVVYNINYGYYSKYDAKTTRNNSNSTTRNNNNTTTRKTNNGTTKNNTRVNSKTKRTSNRTR